MIGQVRTARPGLSMGGTDYYTQLAPYLLNLEYTDNMDGEKADDLHFQLADRDNKFISSWMPKPGAYIDVSIICERWFTPIGGDLSMDCGRFWIDSIEFELPQHTVSVKATSIPTNVRLKASDENRGWDNAKLKDVAQQIAQENNMTLDWEAQANPAYIRTEQIEESGLAFLKKRCTDAKLAIKVTRNKIIVFDEQDYEAKAPQFAIVYGNAMSNNGLPTYRMSGGQFNKQIADVSKKASVTYTKPETGQLENEDYTAEGDDDLPDDVDTQVNEDPGDDQAGEGLGSEGEGLVLAPRDSGIQVDPWNADASVSAARKAKATLRDKNKDKNNAKIDMALGNPLIAAGMTFMLSGVGQFDGKWFVISAEHKVAPMYTTVLTVRRCLTGY
jgi:phage protein D